MTFTNSQTHKCVVISNLFCSKNFPLKFYQTDFCVSRTKGDISSDTCTWSKNFQNNSLHILSSALCHIYTEMEEWSTWISLTMSSPESDTTIWNSYATKVFRLKFDRATCIVQKANTSVKFGTAPLPVYYSTTYHFRWLTEQQQWNVNWLGVVLWATYKA